MAQSPERLQMLLAQALYQASATFGCSEAQEGSWRSSGCPTCRVMAICTSRKDQRLSGRCGGQWEQ